MLWRMIHRELRHENVCNSSVPKLLFLLGYQSGKFQPQKDSNSGKFGTLNFGILAMNLIIAENRCDLCVAAMVMEFRQSLMSNHVFGV